MKLNQYLAKNNIKPSVLKRRLEDKWDVKLTNQGLWNWLNEKRKPSGLHIAMIQVISEDEVQAIDWYDELEENGQIQQR